VLPARKMERTPAVTGLPGERMLLVGEAVQRLHQEAVETCLDRLGLQAAVETSQGHQTDREAVADRTHQGEEVCKGE
jgi:hypothetical protein